MKRLAVLLVAALATACSSPYQSSGIPADAAEFGSAQREFVTDYARRRHHAGEPKLR